MWGGASSSALARPLLKGRHRMRRLLVILSIAFVLTMAIGLSACSNSAPTHRPTTTTTLVVPSVTTTTVHVPTPAEIHKWDVAVWKQAVWLNAVWNNAVRVNEEEHSYAYGPTYRPHVVPFSDNVPPDIGNVMVCIRGHESGNYSESGHPNGSSGAYQYEPGTWGTWSVRAGYYSLDSHGNQVPTYTRAYMAPASVQDAVTAYALTHGGAGNWSMRWGNDPCTAGLPGGG
jgi:hypothetical protein